MRRAFAALILSALVLAAPSLAEDAGWERAYGGRGEDRLDALIAVGNGLLAAGSTFSADGDLGARTRAGETGWALRLNADGSVRWSLCSAHAGRAHMGAPYAHADGSVSLILSGEEAGCEWLRVDDARGEVTARIELPDGACAHDPSASVSMLGATDMLGKPAMILAVRHADGTRCFPLLDEQGAVTPGALFPADGSAYALLRTGAGGHVARVRAQDGMACIEWTVAGRGGEARAFSLPVAGALCDVLDAAVCEDGSVILSGRVNGGSVLLRASADGEALFAVHPSGEAGKLALTRSGFAAATADALLFFDEEGALLGETPLDEPQNPLALAGFGDGAATLRRFEGAAIKQAVVWAAPQRGEPDAGAYDAALYARQGSRILAAQAAADGILLRLQDTDGQTADLLVDADGAVHSAPSAPAPAAQGMQALSSGSVRWEEVIGGALVTRLGPDGNAFWRTRVPIKTAADQLQLRFAVELPGGDLLFGGCLSTSKGDTPEREAVLALLGGEGALRAFYTEPDADAFCAALPLDGALALLAATDAGYQSLVTEALVLGREGRAAARCPLAIPLEEDGVFLLHATGGELIAAGTALRNGRASAVLQSVDLP